MPRHTATIFGGWAALCTWAILCSGAPAPTASAQLPPDGFQYWYQGTSAFGTPPGHLHAFGWAVASGDFNFDGFADLAIGEPEADDGAVRGAGVVHVLYGGPAPACNGAAPSSFTRMPPASSTSPRKTTGSVPRLPGGDGGLSWNGQRLWTQESPGMPGAAEDNDSFGRSLADADFDGDGIRDDLAVGTWGETVGGTDDAGGVMLP